MVVLRDRQVPRRRPQILPKRQDADVRVAEVPHRGDQLIALLAETEDDAGLGEQRRRRRTRAPEQLERALVAPAVARDLVEPRDGLRIMVQDVGPGVDHGLERAGRALEIRNQHLDLATRPLPADGANRRGEVRRAAVGQVVAVHRGDDHVLQAESRDRAPDAFGLLAVFPDRFAVRDRAIAAVPRADVAENHERRGPVVPAFADVGTMRLLAHRVQILRAHEGPEPDVVRSSRRPDLEPARLASILERRGLKNRKRNSHKV